jgi:uncharacterized protein involved in outer membrane biogenesis
VATAAPSSRTQWAHRHWLRLVLVPLLVVVGILIVVLANPTAVARQVEQRVVPALSQRLGRVVQVGEIHAGFFPRVHVSLSRVEVAGGPDEPPLMTARQAKVSFKLWPLLLSRGRDVQASSIELRDVNVNLVRRPDGTWSYRDLGTAASQADQSPSSPGPSTAIAITKISLVNGSVHVIDQAKDQPAERANKTVALTKLGVTAHGVTPGHRMSVNFKGAVASDQPNLKGSLTVDPLPASVAEFTSDHGPTLTGEIVLSALSLQKVSDWLPTGLSQRIEGGVVNVSAQAATEKDGHYGVSSQAKIDHLSLHGSVASGSAELHATVTTGPPRLLAVRLTALRFMGLGTDLTGTASYEAANAHVQFALSGPQANLDELSRALSEEKPRREEPTRSPSKRQAIRTAHVEGTITLGQFTVGKLRAEKLAMKTTLDQGVLTINEGRADVYGGTMVFDHSTVNFLPEEPNWDIRASLEGMDFGRAAQEVAGSNDASGVMSAQASLRSTGSDWQEFSHRLTGSGRASLVKGELATTNLVAQIEEPLLDALQELRLAKPAPQSKKRVAQHDLSVAFTLKDGWAHVEEPVSINTEFGSVSLSGRLGLDERLDMKGEAILSPGFLVSVATSPVLPKAGVHVPFHLGGTVSNPQVENVDWSGVARNVLLGEGLPGKTLGVGKNAEETVRKKIGGALRHL